MAKEVNKLEAKQSLRFNPEKGEFEWTPEDFSDSHIVTELKCSDPYPYKIET